MSQYVSVSNEEAPSPTSFVLQSALPGVVMSGVRVSWCLGHSSQGSRVRTAMTVACSSFDLSFVSCNSSWSNVVSPGFGTKNKYIYIYTNVCCDKQVQTGFESDTTGMHEALWKKNGMCEGSTLTAAATGAEFTSQGDDEASDQGPQSRPNVCASTRWTTGRTAKQCYSTTCFTRPPDIAVSVKHWSMKHWEYIKWCQAHGLRWTKFFSFLCELPTRLSRHTKICFSFLQHAFSCFSHFCQSLELSCSEFQREALCGRE